MRHELSHKNLYGEFNSYFVQVFCFLKLFLMVGKGLKYNAQYYMYIPIHV